MKSYHVSENLSAIQIANDGQQAIVVPRKELQVALQIAAKFPAGCHSRRAGIVNALQNAGILKTNNSSDSQVASYITWQNKKVKPKQSVIHLTFHRVPAIGHCDEAPVTLCGRTIPGYSWKSGEVLADDWESWNYIPYGIDEDGKPTMKDGVYPCRFCSRCEAKQNKILDKREDQ